jgi:Asp-tRNA(Asn)/Glu-tRNA(Gln) amidotransferase A subunit family amidase
VRTLVEQAKAVADGSVSPTELVRVALEGIERVEPATNAFTHVRPDDAYDRAAELEGREPSGPLFGVPVAIKELYDIAGLRTTGCCAAFEDRMATAHSAVVERLREAGAIVIAKTNQHEMACGATNLLSSFGPTRNPWDTRRITGGSSGGSAAAVAAGVVAMAMGSDTGGSVRIPSSFCGVTGLKTTHGAVSLRGAMPLVPSLDTAGPLAASAADCALVFNVLCGFDPADPWSAEPHPIAERPLRGARIGILQRFMAWAHPETIAGVTACAGELESLGAIVEEIDGPDPDEAWEAVGPVFVTEFASCYPDLGDDERAHPEVRALIAAGASIPGTVYAQGLRACRVFGRRFEAALADADVLLAPSTPYPAPRADATEVRLDGKTLDVHSGGPAHLTMPVNVAGLPAVAFPVGFSAEGLPLGAQLIGPAWSEPQLCAMVDAYQEATVWHLRQPQLG